MSKNAKDLAARYGRKSDIIEIMEEIIEEKRRNGELDDLALEEYRASAYPVKINNETGSYYSYKKYPVITSDPSIQVMEWGLIPFWVKTFKQAEELRRITINARAESLFEKPSYRVPIMRRRCIIPSTGYFEFHYDSPKSKAQPYFIFLKSLEIFSMAGIYDSWIDPDSGKELMTFSQITTAGNRKTNLIHNGGKNPFRMPLILTPEQEEIWLDNSLSEEEIKELLVTFPAKDMDAYPIHKELFLKTDPHNYKIIDPDRSIESVLR